MPFAFARIELNCGRTFTPVPKRVMDGSEDGDVLAAAVLSGAPIELQARTVRYVCYRPSRAPLADNT